MPDISPIPVLGNQAVGASYLSALSGGIEWLLGQSHAPQTMPLAVTFSRVETGYETRWRGWGPHVSDTLCYCFRLYGTGAHRARIQVDTTGANNWVTAWDSGEMTGGNRSYHATADLTALGLTIGTWYRWRIQIGGSGALNGSMELWFLGERRALGNWQAMPAFTERQSAAADLNTLRGNVYVLRDLAGRHNWPSGFGLEKVTNGTMTAQMGAYRYRPERIVVGLEVKALPAQTWEHIVEMRTLDDAMDEQIATSGPKSGTGVWQWSTLDIDTSAFGLTLNAPYLVRSRLVIGNTSTSAGHARNGYIARWSSGVPTAGWAAMTAWAHGARQMNPDNLNEMRNNLYLLATGGGEELIGDVYFHGINTSDEERFLTLVHRKRFLHYIPRDSNPATLWYGTGLTESAALQGSNTWRVADMEAQPVPYGMTYSVSDAYFAMESDDA
jgi:hypothetical protein